MVIQTETNPEKVPDMSPLEQSNLSANLPSLDEHSITRPNEQDTRIAMMPGNSQGEGLVENVMLSPSYFLGKHLGMYKEINPASPNMTKKMHHNYTTTGLICFATCSKLI
ncbi:uncharacterized protein ACMZJ9_010767 isoform 3-T3 [Mantella aurantiaca]